MKFAPSLFLLLTACLSGLISCTESTGNQAKQTNQPASHQKMIDLLAEVKRKTDNPDNIYAASARILHFDALLNSSTDAEAQVNAAFQKAASLIEYGDETQAISLYELLLQSVQSAPEAQMMVLEAAGLAYMRLAERNNCNNNHRAESCIMPIQGEGVHQDKAPARKAVEIYTTILKNNPQNYNARWLLNIAYMTLGEYPAKVPKDWLIPNLDQPGPVQVKPFTDMAPDLDLAVNNRAGGCIVDDFNNDGYLDIATSAWGLDDPMHLYINNADGTFTDASKSSGLSTITGGLNMTHADYNNDGFVDIFVLRGGWQGQGGFGDQPNSLLRNNGDGTFSDVAIDAGMLSYHPSQTATWNDYNHDGWLDVFIGNETMDDANPHPCELYINNQDGSFTNVVTPNNLNILAFVKGVTSGDYDNDGWPDLFISTMSDQKLLLRNLGVAGKVPAFEDVTQKAGFGGLNTRTFPAGFFDYDNDGWLDLFVCNYEFERPLSYYSAKEALHPSADEAGKLFIYHNNGNGTFSKTSTRMHMNQTVFAMAGNFGDIDNDGWLDLYMSTGNPNYQSLVPNKLYKNMGGKDFADVTVSARVGNLQKGHGVAFADLNNNGDQDIFVEMGGAYNSDVYPASFYLNPGQSANNWICLKLEGVQSNRSAIGAKITVRFRENGAARMVYREVTEGGSFGCSPFRREIGIGSATLIDEITIQWPASGVTQTFKDVQPNQFVRVTEGKDVLEPVALKYLPFKKKDGTMPMCAPAR